LIKLSRLFQIEAARAWDPDEHAHLAEMADAMRERAAVAIVLGRDPLAPSPRVPSPRFPGKVRP
jgi:hypothetical protein